MKIEFEPIGIVRSPFKNAEGTPAQPAIDKGTDGSIEIYPQFAEGLKDLDLFSHAYIFFHLHKAVRKELLVTPFMDTVKRGVFATRSPGRPNSLGMSVVSIVRVEGNIVHISNHDLLDGSPVLDIKPYVSKFDIFTNTCDGWFADKLHKADNQTDDGRFTR